MTFAVASFGMWFALVTFGMACAMASVAMVYDILVSLTCGHLVAVRVQVKADTGSSGARSIAYLERKRRRCPICARARRVDLRALAPRD